MTDRTKEIVQNLAKACVARVKACPDYSEKPSNKKTAEMCLNYFVGAAALAQASGDTELVNHLTSYLAFGVAIRGYSEVLRTAGGL